MKKKESMNALKLLKEDHDKVKDLFEQYEKSDENKEKKELAETAIKELKIHSTIEEEIFYPEVRKEIEENDEEIMDEAAEEHHVAKFLIAELSELDSDDSTYEAKFTVLAENVRHHIKEEEGEMFPKVRKTEIDLNELGERMMQRKQELMTGEIPETQEEKMVHAGR